MSLVWKGSISSAAPTCETRINSSASAPAGIGARRFKAHSPRPTSSLNSRVRHPLLYAHRRAGLPRAEKEFTKALAKCSEGIRSRRRADHSQADAGPRQRCPIGGLKVATRSGWFAARPSGTENIYKIYAESVKSEQHLQFIVAEAQEIVNNALRSPAAGQP